MQVTFQSACDAMVLRGGYPAAIVAPARLAHHHLTMILPDIELIIARTPSGSATASLRIELPSRRSDLAEAVPIDLNDPVLRALSAQTDVYGAALTAMVFPSVLREAWQRARGFAEGIGTMMRVRLVLQGDDALHAIRWELLRDPLDAMPLAHSERIRLSRFLSSTSLVEIQASSRSNVRAVVAVANPAILSAYPQLAPIDVAGEVTRVQAGLGTLQLTLIDGRNDRPTPTLSAIGAALRDGADILYLVCHGGLTDAGPLLWLEQEGEATGRPIAGDDLVQMIAQLEHRPLLVVLASCHGAGDTYAVLAAVGPALARAGVGAVIAMQGNVSAELVAKLMPRLFTELRRDGQIDRALAVARSALPRAGDWWMPTLWMAVRDGALWRSITTGEDPDRIARLRALTQDQGSFVTGRLERFVGRTTELAEVRALIAELRPSGGYLTISGQAGQGKSSLMARMIADTETSATGAEVVYHVIPFNPGPDHQVSILRNLLAQLCLHYHLSENYAHGESRAVLRDAFARALQELARRGESVMIYIDGLDQIEADQDGSRDFSFLPETAPAGVVVVLGTRPDDTLQDLALRQPQRQYALPPLSRSDFAELLASRNASLTPALADRLYKALQASPLYLDLAARELALAPEIDLNQLIARLADDPQHLFTISISRLRRSRKQWKTVIRPILGALLVLRRSLSRAALRRLLQVDDEDVREGLERLGGLILRDQWGYTLYHLKLREYLREDPARPDKPSVFAADEEREQHHRLATWGTPDDPLIWENTTDAVEQERRHYARRHSVYHLARAAAFDKLWALLDDGPYLQNKLRNDPSTRMLTLDLDEARQAVISASGGGHVQSLALLPRLWSYSLLCVSLTGRVERYPDELLLALASLGRIHEAKAMCNLFSDPLRRATSLCALGSAFSAQGDAAQARRLLMRAAELTSDWSEQQRQRILVPIIDQLVYLGNFSEALALASALPLHPSAILGTRGYALARLAVAMVQADGSAEALKILDDLPATQRNAARAEAVRELASEGRCAEAYTVAESISDRAQRTLADHAIIAAEMHLTAAQGQTAITLARALEITIPRERDRALKNAARAAAWAGHLDAADSLASTITGRYEHARALAGIAATTDDPQREQAARTAAQELVADDYNRALGGLAIDLATVGRATSALQALEALHSLYHRSHAAAGVARRLITAGAIDAAKVGVHMMFAYPLDSWRNDLGTIIADLIMTGHSKAAHDLLTELVPEREQVWAGAVLSFAYARAGQRKEAAHWIAESQRQATIDAQRPDARDLICQTVARALALGGQPEAALRAASSISDLQQRIDSQIAVHVLANTPDRARSLAQTISDDGRRSVLLGDLAHALIQRDQLMVAEHVITLIDPGYQHDRAAAELAAAFAAHGQLAKVEHLATGRSDQRFQAKIFAILAVACIRTGSTTDAERAIAAAATALAAIPATQAGVREEAQAAIATALVAMHRLNEAVQIFHDLALDSRQRYELAPLLIQSLVYDNRTNEARQLAREQQPGYPRDEAFAALCGALAAAGDLEGAQETTGEFGTEEARVRRQRAIAEGLLSAGRMDEVIEMVRWPPLATDVTLLCHIALELTRRYRETEATMLFEQAAWVTTLPEATAQHPELAAVLTAALAEAKRYTWMIQLVQLWWRNAQTHEDLLALLPAAMPLLIVAPELGPALLVAYDDIGQRLTEMT